MAPNPLPEEEVDKRLELHNILVSLTGVDVYFQPPDAFLLNYPCIVYKKNKPNVLHAGNVRYSEKENYTLTIIERSISNTLTDLLLTLPYSSIDRYFPSDSLNHTVINLYY